MAFLDHVSGLLATHQGAERSLVKKYWGNRLSFAFARAQADNLINSIDMCLGREYADYRVLMPDYIRRR